MKLSRFFLPLLKENPREATMPSHRLMLRAGLIRQAAAGIFSWLPFGQLALDRVNQIIRSEHAKLGALEIVVPCLQPVTFWQESHRNQAYGKEMLRMQDRRGQEMIYAPTNEELITDIFRQTVTSYKQLPILLYLIGNKFRDEIRPRFGTMRSREFIMKDAYSFDSSEAEARLTYQRMFACYIQIFEKMGLKAYPVQASTGAIGGNLSHEFVIPTATGDTTIMAKSDFYEITKTQGDATELFEIWNKDGAINDEYLAEHQEAQRRDMVEKTGVEVAHLFYFGQKYTTAMEAAVQGSDGGKTYPYMGSYGIGTTRLVAAIIEANHDEKGIVWPEPIAPFQVMLINMDYNCEQCQKQCEEIYHKLSAQGLDVLYDDQAAAPGVKFAQADLIGIPWQVVIGKRELARQSATIKHRGSQTKETLNLATCVDTLLTRVQDRRTSVSN